MGDQQSRYKVTITWASDNAKIEKDIEAWEPEDAARSITSEVWCRENGERGEDEAVVEVSTTGETISRFYDVSTEPDLHINVRRLDAEDAAEVLARWAELDAEFKAKMAEREAAKSPREKLFDLVRKARRGALTLEEIAQFGKLLIAPPISKDDGETLVLLCMALTEQHSVQQRIDRLIAQLPLDDQSTSSPVSASIS